MEITEVRIKLMEDSDDRLQAFCSVTFDNAFVVRDLKIIDGANGPFVAMPSRKLTSHCPQCGYKNHLRAHYCNQCGGRLREERTIRDADGRVKLYADIAHPINAQCRELIQKRVIAEFEAELGRATEPGYVSRYDDDYGWDYDEDAVEVIDERPPAPASRAHAAPTHPASGPATSSHSTQHSMPPATPSATSHSIVPSSVPTPAGPKSGEGEGDRRSDKKIVPQPAAHEPRAPHAPTTGGTTSAATPVAASTPMAAQLAAPAAATSGAASSASTPKAPTGRAKNSAFGAGIFDEKS